MTDYTQYKTQTLQGLQSALNREISALNDSHFVVDVQPFQDSIANTQTAILHLTANDITDDSYAGWSSAASAIASSIQQDMKELGQYTPGQIAGDVKDGLVDAAGQAAQEVSDAALKGLSIGSGLLLAVVALVIVVKVL